MFLLYLTPRPHFFSYPLCSYLITWSLLASFCKMWNVSISLLSPNLSLIIYSLKLLPISHFISHFVRTAHQWSPFYIPDKFVSVRTTMLSFCQIPFPFELFLEFLNSPRILLHRLIRSELHCYKQPWYHLLQFAIALITILVNEIISKLTNKNLNLV